MRLVSLTSLDSTDRVSLTGFTVLLLGILVLLSFLPLPGHAALQYAEDQKKSAHFEYVPGELLVRFRDDATATKGGRSEISEAVNGRQLQIRLERLGGSKTEIVRGLRLARVPVEDTEQTLELLRSRPDVLYAEPNYLMRKQQLPNDPRFSEQWALRNTQTPIADIDAEQAWDVTTGSRNVVVGLVDEGIDISHEDLASNIWTNPAEVVGNGVDDDGNGLIDDVHGWDFFHNDNSLYDGPGTNPDGSQIDAHGTHVAGIIGASGNNGVGVTGVNWQVTLLPMKFLGPDGGSAADAIRAYDYARNLRQAWDTSGGTRGANLRVLNNSYGGRHFSQAAFDAINALNDAGILFVVSAGNDAQDNDRFPVYPANYAAPNVVSVASSSTSGSPSSQFSNFGLRTVDLLAPGEQILSTVPNNSYAKFSGTSAAAPYASGTAALVCSAFPNLSMKRLRAALVYGGLNGSFQFTSSGRRVNARNSLDNASEVDSTPPAAVGNLQSISQGNQHYRLEWIAPGDDGTGDGTVAIYEVRYSDTDISSTATFESATRLVSVVPSTPGTLQQDFVAVPYRHPAGFIGVRAIDNVGNAGPITSVQVSADIADADPYVVSNGAPETLSTGGTPLGVHADDKYFNYQLPFDFNFFGTSSRGIEVSTNGALHFAAPSQLPNGQPDIDISGTDYLPGRRLIAGLWDDFRTDRRPDDDVYVVIPDPTKIIFRWQAVTYNSELSEGTLRGENPVNFEIELQRVGNIIIRYGEGNHNVLPVVGASGGMSDAYMVDTHTSDLTPKDLAFAQTVTFSSRRPTPLPNPDLYVGLRTSPDQAPSNQLFTYIVSAGNHSTTQQSEQTVVTDQLPTGTTFVSCITTKGTCTGPPVGSTGTVTAQLGALTPNFVNSAEITITVQVTAAVGSTLTDKASISGYWADSDPSNNSASINTDVVAPFSFPDLVQLSAGGGNFGGGHTLALRSDGHVWSWGLNYSGQLGDGTSSNTVNSPVLAVGLSDVIAIDTGRSHSLAIKSDGSVWAWGDNYSGQSGQFEQFYTIKPRPTKVAGLSGNFTAVAAGADHSLALRSDGTVWGWGYNGGGQLGDGTTSGSGVYTPVQVTGLTGVVAIAAGSAFSLALKADGTVWAWGSNQNLILGLPAETLSSTAPVKIGGLTDITAISAGSFHVLALQRDGTAWAWGYNFFGQLGSGDASGFGSFGVRRVSGLTSVTQISGGTQHSLALKSDGTVWAWGYNGDGELGVGTTTSSNVPVQVSGITATSVTAGFNQSGAILTDGLVRMWGGNDNGELGDRTRLRRLSPVEISGPAPVGTPILTPDGGTFNNLVGVSLNSSTAGAVIYYTMDGTTPTENDAAVSNGGKIVVNRSVTLKARAFKFGSPSSSVKSSTFILPTPSPTPTPVPFASGITQSIAFARGLGTTSEIFVINPDGSGEFNFTNNPSNDREPAWLPDGTQLSYATDRTGDGLTHIALEDTNGADIQIRDRHVGASDGSPAWAPDGSKLALVSTYSSNGLTNILVLSADGTFGYGGINNFGVNLSPTWSPDGAKLAYTFAFLGQPAEILVTSPNALYFSVNLTNSAADDITPSWSPDGSKIAFSTNRDGNYEIYVMNADGSNPQRLTNNAGADRSPSWSPDGSQIVFSSDRDGNDEIYVMSASGSNVMRLTNNSLADVTPTWRKKVPPQLQFSAPNFQVSEGVSSATINVTRTGDVSRSVSVNYATLDDPAEVRCDNNTDNHGAAYARCDYATTIDTLTFATGETTKSFSVPIFDDAHTEGEETVQLLLSSPKGASLGQRTATLTIVDNDPVAAVNPLNSSSFFVRQHYLDFLSREPEGSGLTAWMSVLDNCSDVNNNPTCDRLTVSSSFFRSDEFQLKGFYVFKFYQLTLGRLPTYAEISVDMRRVTGQTADEVFAKRDAFAKDWTQRQEFRDRFDKLNDSDFLDRLLRTAGLEQLSGTVTRQSLINDLVAAQKTRTDVLRALVEHPDLDAVEYNAAFVAMQYYGYLRRTPETEGYNAWLGYLNAHPTDSRTMVNGFMNSAEYRLRFGP